MNRLSSLLVNSLAGSVFLKPEERLRIYKRFGLRAWNGIWIEPRCYFHSTDLRQIALGDGVFINSYCHFDNTGTIAIGKNTRIANHVQFLTTTHPRGFPHSGRGAIVKDIVIGHDCWLGAGVKILAGAYVGDRAIIAAGSVILQDQVIPDDSFYAGVPARDKGRVEAIL